MEIFVNIDSCGLCFGNRSGISAYVAPFDDAGESSVKYFMGNQRFVNPFYDNPVGLLVLEIATLSLLRTQVAVGMHSKERRLCVCCMPRQPYPTKIAWILRRMTSQPCENGTVPRSQHQSSNPFRADRERNLCVNSGRGRKERVREFVADFSHMRTQP